MKNSKIYASMGIWTRDIRVKPLIIQLDANDSVHYSVTVLQSQCLMTVKKSVLLWPDKNLY